MVYELLKIDNDLVQMVTIYQVSLNGQTLQNDGKTLNELDVILIMLKIFLMIFYYHLIDIVDEVAHGFMINEYNEDIGIHRQVVGISDLM